MGRPTSYRKEFCEKVRALGAKGKSKAQIAAALGVSRMTVDRWCDDHPLFCDAIAHARDSALAWWEDQAQKHMLEKAKGSKLNAHIWSRSMAARFPDDYRESSKVELGGSLALTKMSDEEIDEELAALEAAERAVRTIAQGAPQAGDIDPCA
jgi:hypothetical protein